MSPFYAGAVIAELDIIKLSRTSNLPSPENHDSATKPTKSFPHCENNLTTLLYWITILISLFLLSYPDAAGHATPGYITLTTLIPEKFTQKHRFWPTIGAVMIVWSSSNLHALRNKAFCLPPIRYLGKISFPLYVVHGPVIHTLGYMVSQTSPLTNFEC